MLCVFLVLDEMRERSVMEGWATTGKGLKWGVLIGLGPGLTMETLVLHCVSLLRVQGSRALDWLDVFLP